MQFVDLQRHFVPIRKDEEPDFTIGQTWGLKYGGWLNWLALLARERVVLLAEAASGKTEEFTNAVTRLRASGAIAFFARIENLADGMFLPGASDQDLLARWRAGDERAWFFLDSVDEARLNRKNFDDALRFLSAQLSGHLAHASVLVSCRVSDWRNRSDPTAILGILPLQKPPPTTAPPTDPDEALLDPIFAPEPAGCKPEADQPETDAQQSDLLVVQLVPLTGEQRRTLAQACAVPDVEALLEAITLHGLEVQAQWPGDFIRLAEYWKEEKKFGSLRTMTETLMQTKLRERDRYRPDNEALTEADARLGAERLAAALTLGKSFTLASPGAEADPALSIGALDPAPLFDRWTTTQTNALLRRGLFAPSTYGRVRFHHSSAQEYLAAQWLRRLLDTGCKRSEVESLLFANVYGVQTVVPSLRASAAWLALDHPEFQDGIIDREPMILLTHGDPGSLPVAVRAKLLLHLAKRHADGEIADDSVDHRSLWMFATPALAAAIREAWDINSRPEFRANLVRLIREGKIAPCVDLAAQIARDKAINDYVRAAAAEALVACNAVKELKALRRWLLSKTAQPSPRLAARLAQVLFPAYLSVPELLQIIARFDEPKDRATDGFAYAIDGLWEACPPSDRPALISGVALLCSQPPYIDPRHRRVATAHAALAMRLGGVAHAEVTALGQAAPSPGLVALLAVVERAERGVRLEEDNPPLNALVRANLNLHRALFWHDVAEVRASRGTPVIEFWDLFFGGSPLWHLSEADLPWLNEDLRSPVEDDRRVALSAIISLLQTDVESHAAALRKTLKGDATLTADLARALAPRKRDPSLARHERDSARRKREREAREEKGKASWLSFREQLKADPTKLADPKCVNWLLNLTEWLRRKTKKVHEAAAVEWQLLGPAFGMPVAEAYRDGMKALWRVTTPVAPVRAAGGASSVKWVTILSVGGLAIEAKDDSAFVGKLSKAEAMRAALHACLSDQGYPDWLDALMAASPGEVVLIVADAVRREWADLSGPSYVSYHLAPETMAIPTALGIELFTILTGAEPTSVNMLDRGIEILRRISISDAQRIRLRTLARKRFKEHTGSDPAKPEWAARYLGVMFFLDPAEAFRMFASFIRAQVKQKRRDLAETLLGLLFGSHNPLAYGALSSTPVATLESLLLLAYQLIRPEDDIVRDGSYTPDKRDDAESARNAILKCLIDTSGVDAHGAMMRLSRHRDLTSRRIRFRELARRMAERDADPAAWTPAQVLQFERENLLLVTTPDQLYRAARAVLTQIAWDFDHEDASSRAVLESAKDEDAVQAYLAEQLRLRAKSRYHVTRENEVAEGNMPDVRLSATQAACELAIEAKHGGKGWSAKALDAALHNQLAEDYLRTAQRRRGILVITNHKKRGWRHPATQKPLSFDEMIAYLEGRAAKIKRNKVGDISVCVVGIDALPRARSRPAKRQ